MTAREYPERPIAGVGAVILRDEAVLLVRRDRPPLQGGWSLPGGAHELGESAHEALLREVREETGLKIEVRGFLELVDFIDKDDEGGTRFHYVLADYWGTSEEGELRAGSDVSDARFVLLTELDDYGLWAKTRELIDKAVASREVTKAPTHSFTGHLKTAFLAVLFGMGAFGFIKALIALIAAFR